MANRPKTLRATTQECIRLGNRELEYRLVRSASAKKLRVKIALDGMQVILPPTRKAEEARAFLLENEAWVMDQLARMDRYQSVRRPETAAAGEILYRGMPTPIRVVNKRDWHGPSRISYGTDGILLQRGHTSRTPAAVTLENWLRKQAKQLELTH
jgi:predicted metal-dependent hydrolase